MGNPYLEVDLQMDIVEDQQEKVELNLVMMVGPLGLVPGVEALGYFEAKDLPWSI